MRAPQSDSPSAFVPPSAFLLGRPYHYRPDLFQFCGLSFTTALDLDEVEAGDLPPCVGDGPGPFPYDMLPPLPSPEVLEQKLAAQHREMQKLAVENDRLAVSHASLRKELAVAQQELQRLQAQRDAVKAAKVQEMRGLLERFAEMEADLIACETVKAELQQAHAEVQSLAGVRQKIMVDVQKLSKDLQRNLDEAQQLPVLMAERDVARQEYQHLRVDHSESLQAMKRNYDSMEPGMLASSI